MRLQYLMAAVSPIQGKFWTHNIAILFVNGCAMKEVNGHILQDCAQQCMGHTRHALLVIHVDETLEHISEGLGD